MLEEKLSGDVCKDIARVCAEAAMLEAIIPRPGLTSVMRPRSDHDPWSFVKLPSYAYESCLCSCRRGYILANGWSSCWRRSVEELARWGNPGLGMLFLQSLQAAAVGASAREERDLEDYAIMGWSRRLIEAEDIMGAVNFYAALHAVSPSYLGRISHGGLPDVATGLLALEEIVERGITLAYIADVASLYDPVLQDASRLLSISLGYILPLLEAKAKSHGVIEAVKRVLYHAAARLDDFIMKRKLGEEANKAKELFSEAEHGSILAESLLWRFFRGKRAGPGSIADLLVNALTRLLYKQARSSVMFSLV